MNSMEWFFSKLKAKPAPPIENVLPVKPSAVPRWMDVALKEAGVKEISGDKDNPRVLEYLKGTHYKPSSGVWHDEIAWCSAFVDWCFDQCKMKSTNSAGASSWLNWGVKLDKPKYGCVVVSRRDGGNHVSFFVREEKQNGIRGFIGFGGNQANAVNEKWKPLSSVRGYRWPEDA